MVVDILIGIVQLIMLIVLVVLRNRVTKLEQKVAALEKARKSPFVVIET